jgi:hypothetical protein
MLAAMPTNGSLVIMIPRAVRNSWGMQYIGHKRPDVADDFDAYHKWLGIPPKDQPPNHYRLLALDLFESDPDVIDAAASKQVAYLRSCATGPHVALSQKILNEIASARLCLLDPKKKAAYDAAFRSDGGVAVPSRSRDSSDASSVKAPAAPNGTAGAPVVSAEPHVSVVARQRRKDSTHRKSQPWPLYAAIVAGTLVLVILFAVLMSGPGSDEAVHSDQRERPASKPADTAAADSTAAPGARVAAATRSENEESPQPEAEHRNTAPEPEEPSPSEPLPTQPTVEAIEDPEGSIDTAASSNKGEPDDSSNSPVVPTVPVLAPDAEEELKRRLREAKALQDYEEVARDALQCVDQAIVANDAETAKELATLAIRAARECQDNELHKTAALRRVDVERPLTDAVIEDARKRLGAWQPPSASEAEASVRKDASASVAGSEPPQRSLADLVKAGSDGDNGAGSGGTRSPEGNDSTLAEPGVSENVNGKPGLLQTKKQLFARHPNYARWDGLSFDVGIGNEYWGVGIAAVGYELENVMTVQTEARVNGRLDRYDDNSFVGFIIDYHTPGGYTKRVALSLGMSFKGRKNTPEWGKGKPPDVFVDLPKAPTNVINLKEWAPSEWDGRIWFSVLNQNGGKNTSITGRIVVPGLQ